MKKIFALGVFSVIFFLFNWLVGIRVPTHESYNLVLVFFIVQTLVLFRLDAFTKEDIKVQMSMVKMGTRLLSALAFTFYLNSKYPETLSQALFQFIIIYLAFMTFEIIMALSNLRRN